MQACIPGRDSKKTQRQKVHSEQFLSTNLATDTFISPVLAARILHDSNVSIWRHENQLENWAVILREQHYGTNK